METAILNHGEKSEIFNTSWIFPGKKCELHEYYKMYFEEDGLAREGLQKDRSRFLSSLRHMVGKEYISGNAKEGYILLNEPIIVSPAKTGKTSPSNRQPIVKPLTNTMKTFEFPDTSVKSCEISAYTSIPTNVGDISEVIQFYQMEMDTLEHILRIIIETEMYNLEHRLNIIKQTINVLRQPSEPFLN